MENLQRLKRPSSRSVLLLLLSLSLMALVTDASYAQDKETTRFKLWTWFTVDSKRSDNFFKSEFKKYAENGIDAVLINTYAKPNLLRRIAPLAKEVGLEVHAWMFTVNRPGDSIAQKHPEWYAVSRDQKSTFDQPPYVDYYKWLCPTRKESRAHILSLVKGLAEVEGVASVHLDYIRYSDIFLPIGLLPKYNLKQEVELPQYDFCYCEVCTKTFESIHHKNPKDFKNPALDMEWKNFRLNQIKTLVGQAYDLAHAHDKILTAAVFPFPEMADHMVRQRWDKWKVDVVLPMIYHNFYNEEIDWIGYATRQGIQDLQSRSIELHTGIYLNETSGEELETAIELARQNGAQGIALFDGPSIKEEHWKIIKDIKR